jgi:hypothetical protein
MLFRNVVAQFIGPPSFVIARLIPSETGELAEAIPWGMRLPRTLQMPAMTRSGRPDESDNYESLEVKALQNA